MRHYRFIFGLLCALVMLAAAAPAFADDDWRQGDDWRRHEMDEHRQHEWWEHQRREQAWREHELRERQGYYAPPVVVAPPGFGFNRPQPPFYAAPPAFYGAPPPAFYNNPR